MQIASCTAAEVSQLYLLAKLSFNWTMSRYRYWRGRRHAGICIDGSTIEGVSGTKWHPGLVQSLGNFVPEAETHSWSKCLMQAARVNLYAYLKV